jgi:hypothetical protein
MYRHNISRTQVNTDPVTTVIAVLCWNIPKIMESLFFDGIKNCSTPLARDFQCDSDEHTFKAIG